MSSLSETTLQNLANALVDDIIVYIQEDCMYVEFFKSIVGDAIRRKLGDLDDDTIDELGRYIFDRVALQSHEASGTDKFVHCKLRS